MLLQPFQDFSLADVYMLFRSVSAQTGKRFQSQYFEKRASFIREYGKKYNQPDYQRFLEGQVERMLENHIKEGNSLPTKWKTVSHIEADHLDGSCRLFKLTKILIQLMKGDESFAYCRRCQHLSCEKCYRLRNRLNDLGRSIEKEMGE